MSFTKQVRDIANTAKTEPEATDRGITQPRILHLTSAINTYEPLITAPRTQIVNRSTLLRELETRTADLLEMLVDLDDLVVQFDTTDLGHRFVSAWMQARTILDRGHRFDTPTPPDPNPTPTPTP